MEEEDMTTKTNNGAHVQNPPLKNMSTIDSPLVDPKPSDRTVEASISEELLKLSLNDRSAVEEEIHGVRCMATEETPEILAISLAEFNTELIRLKEEREQKMPSSERPCDVLRNVITPGSEDDDIKYVEQNYGMKNVQQCNSSKASTTSTNRECRPRKKRECYVNDPAVRIRFVRCECFDSIKAAKRFVNYLEFTKLLFGDFISYRPPKYSDFENANGGDDEVKCLQNSRFTYLPYRDRTGRRVSCGVGHTNHKFDAALRYKIIMYLDWIVSQDIETQRKGIVIVAWPSGEDGGQCNDDDEKDYPGKGGEKQEDIWQRYIRPSLSQRDIWFQQKGFESTPLRIAAIHFCAQNKRFYRVISSFYYFGLDSQHKKRYKAHFGNQTEILYRLQQYGIPIDLIPITHTGAVKTGSHVQWVRSRKLIEAEYEENKGEEILWVECPRSYDVLFRRGKSYAHKHMGNLMYRCLIEAASREHLTAATRQEKVDLTWKVVRQIEERYKGRFLIWDSSWKCYVQIVERRKMRDKVAQSIKELTRGMLQTELASNKIDSVNASSNDHKSAKITLYNDDFRQHDGANPTSTKRRKIISKSAATNLEETQTFTPDCLCSGLDSNVGCLPHLSSL